MIYLIGIDAMGFQALVKIDLLRTFDGSREEYEHAEIVDGSINWTKKKIYDEHSPTIHFSRFLLHSSDALMFLVKSLHGMCEHGMEEIPKGKVEWVGKAILEIHKILKRMEVERGEEEKSSSSGLGGSEESGASGVEVEGGGVQQSPESGQLPDRSEPESRR